ncbi:unnamed protein product [Closterium sp. NIES-65]|nr:unnamed protein product [Closterium sp. NIES-65]
MSRRMRGCIFKFFLSDRLGIACYNAGTQQLVTTETWEESASGEFPTIQLLKFQEQPTVIIASTKSDKAFLNALTTPVEEGGSIFFVKTVKSNLFSYEHAQNRLTFLQWSGMPQGLNATQRLQLLNTKIRLEDDVQVRALGALLTVLQHEMILDNVEVTDNDGDSTSLGVRIGSISQLNLYVNKHDFIILKKTVSNLFPLVFPFLNRDGFLSVDAWTLNSLQIFQSDKHPSPMGIGKTKEGFSVFGLLNKCVTAGGRSMLRMWFLRPIVDLQVIQDRHQAISFLSSFSELLTSLHSFLQHVKDIPKLLMKLKSATTIVTRKDWLQLLESVSYLLEVREVFEVTVAQWQAEKSSNSAFPLIPKGTLVADGVGLLCSTLGFMAAQPIPPKLLVCTHFSEIMNQNLLNPSAQITFCTMAILEQPETVEGSNEITFLYRLKPGRNLDSHGIHCARLAGLPPAVLERSREIQSKIQAGIPVERLSNARTSGRDKCYKNLVDRLLSYDFNSANAKDFISTLPLTIQAEPV